MWRIKLARVIGLVLAVGLVGAACTNTPDSEQRDVEARQSSVERIREQVPVPTVNYAPTRRTIAEWIKRWDAPDKVSFIYLMADNGQFIGYYVAKGLPVSYCVGLTPPSEIQAIAGSHWERPAPGVDGVYYSGGDCNHYYFFDATTDVYIEFGGGLRFFVADEPLPVKVEPLGLTTIEDVREEK